MFHEKIPSRQLISWIFAATVPVGIQLLSGSGWVWTVCGGAISVAACAVLWKIHRETAKWESVFLFVYAVILLGQLLRHTAQCWPMGNSDPAVPLILLVLAAVSAQKGPSAAARVGAVLFWAVLGLYLLVFAAGAKDVKLDWLMPNQKAFNATGMMIYLLPWAAARLLKEHRPLSKKICLAPVFILVGTVVTAGVLSPAVAAKLPNAFYEMSRSLNLFDVARRFEALICAVTAAGWFSLMSLLLTLCGTYAHNVFPEKGRQGLWLAAAAAAVGALCGLHIKPAILLLAGTIFWVIIPLLTQGLDKIKKS